ncbi:hypothetical protein HYU19_04020 [Candidatus Woesearchaeota archaeon]|nr:hypothetical protein [Candidatus Woesearchaeota archaeon]
MEGIALLAKAGVVEEEDVRIYNAAIQRLDKLLAAPELESPRAYSREVSATQASAVTSLTVFTGAIITYITKDTRFLGIAMAFGVIIASSERVYNLFTNGNSAIYRKAIEKRVRKYGNDMNTNITAALDSGVRLLAQLQAGPLYVHAKYADRASEIEQKRRALIEYFEHQPGFFERVRDAGKREK